MLIKEITENQVRNYEEEKNILINFSNSLKPYISLKGIQKKLEQNGFNGVYILDSNLFHLIEKNLNVTGMYFHDEKIIIIDKESYIKDKSIGIHEMGYAFLDGKNYKEIIFDDNSIIYGIGLEEGAMAILQSNLNLKNMDKCNNNIYPLQTRIFKQLNILYKYSNFKEYENLLVHLFKEPKTFIPLIKNMYEDIYMSKLPNLNAELVTKSAFYMISGTDALLENNDNELYNFLSYINSIYLNIADEKIRNENKSDIFMKPNSLQKTVIEKYLYAIFNSDMAYLKRLSSNLDIALSEVLERLDCFDVENLKDNKCKILLPR